MTKWMAGLILVLAAAGCAQEAGIQVDGGTFGNATLNNTQVQTGAKQFAESLNERFQAEVPTTINFAFDSAVLDEPSRATLRRQAEWIRQFPEVRFRVYGHTDAVGSTGYNKRLGKRRADVAVNYLISQGISRNRLEAVVSFGETQPVVATQNRERANRRTMTEVSGFLKRHPTILDGRYAEVIYREYIRSAQPESVLTGIETQSLSTGGQ